MTQVNVEGASPQSGVNAEAASSDVAAHFQAWVVLCICCAKPFYHSGNNFFMQSDFPQELICDYSCSRGGGTELFSNYSYSRRRGTELISNSGYSRRRGTERP